MKKVLFAILIGVLCLTIAVPTFAQEDAMCPGHGGDTIASLKLCVDHAYAEGHITSAATYWTLVVKLNVAQAAIQRGHPSVAVRVLGAFIHQVRAQSGKTIHTEHAVHLIEHTQRVIAALGG